MQYDSNIHRTVGNADQWREPMREHPLRAILSRLLRGPGDPSEVELVYLHRGAPENGVRIRVSTISHLGKGSFMLSDGETQIPFHRVLYVTDLRSKTILWEKRKPLHASCPDL